MERDVANGLATDKNKSFSILRHFSTKLFSAENVNVLGRNVLSQN